MPQGIRLPEIVAVCDDESVLGVHFYVMRYLDGHVVTQRAATRARDARRAAPRSASTSSTHSPRSTPPTSRHRRSRRSHAPAATSSGRCSRFTQLWELNRTREIPAVDEVGRQLAAALPEPLPATVVHGDYRLGNMMVAPDDPSVIAAVLDWEMGAIGDPRADLGYLVATYTEPGRRARARSAAHR